MLDPRSASHPARRAALAAACTIMTFTIAAGAARPASAAPTPVPGGADQIKAIAGTLHQTLFNGKLRLKGMVLREAKPSEETGSPGDNVVILSYIFANGTPKNIYGGTSMTAADADGVVQNCKPVGVYGAYYSMGPAEAKRLMLYCDLPPDFTPVKLIMVPGDGPAFRITLKPSDVPKPPAPAASPAPAS